MGLDFDVSGLTPGTAGRLMHHHTSIRQGEALSLGTGRQQQAAHRCRLTDADRADGAADVSIVL